MSRTRKHLQRNLSRLQLGKSMVLPWTDPLDPLDKIREKPCFCALTLEGWFVA
jgi:hypothetical protein